MKIQDNFSDTHLLFSAPVSFTICDDENAIILARFKLKLPTVADLYFNECIGACLSLLRLTPAELSEHFKVEQKFTSHLDFLYQLLVLSMHSSTLAIAWSRLFDGIKELCPDLHISENILYIAENFKGIPVILEDNIPKTASNKASKSVVIKYII